MSTGDRGGNHMKISRRTVVLGGIAAPLAAPFAAQAQTWPSGVIKIIVPFPPGGSVDPIARLVQPRMQEKLGGATIIIENRPGASGSVGTAAVAKANPDGNSWVFVFDTHAVNPFLQDLSFNTEKDLDPVLLIGTAPNVLCTHPSRPFNSFAEVIAAAKQKPTTITYASIGSGSVGHLTMALLSKRAGVSMVHVPYRGGGPAVTDAIAGHVDLIIGSAALVTPQINGQRLRPLLQTGKARIASLPNTQTAIEAGFPGFESYAWWGVSAPADSLRDPAVAKQLQENLQITLLVQDPEAERKFLQQQMALWGPVVKENNIK